MKPPKPEIVMLPAQMDFDAARDLHTQLSTLRGRPVALDGGQVAYLGALALQVVIAARRLWQADGLPFGLTRVSDDLIEGFDRLGFDPTALQEETAK